MLGRWCLISLLSIIAGCGWIHDYRVRSKAVTEVTNELRASLTKEFHDALGGQFPRDNDFVEFVLGETTVEIVDIPPAQGEHVPVTAKIHTVSSRARRDLLEIIRPLRDQKLNAFNFNDALNLIRQHGVPATDDQEKHLTVEL